ncbi:MAG TPA: M20/M25/M40 family metallo-hydrolase [Acidimicrobiia bacterium]|nr:M20/M25/M40 family metallo-hydrolase [Acidimicrobiia bacterium]
MLTPDEVKARAKALMPGLTEDLKDLVSHASCSFPGFPEEPVHEMRRAAIDVLERHGADVHELDLGEGKPAIYGEMAGPEGAPTVLLYAHYDVQPAPVEAGWDTDPWTAEIKDGRLYGRGAADDKSGVIIHAGTLGVFEGELPVNLRILIEGEEETVSHIGPFVDANPEMFKADTYVIADMGNPAAGVPAVTTTLRGNVIVIVKVKSLEHPAHSGLFGGAAPDALLALIKILGSLHDEAGDTVVPGLAKFEWNGTEMDPDAFRVAAGMVDGAELIGSGTVGARLWSRPMASVIGIDAPSVKDAANVVLPEAAAKISMRIPPGADSENEVGLLIEHLKKAAPWGVHVEVERVRVGYPFSARMDGPAVKAALAAMQAAYDTESGFMGSGGSIPLVARLQGISPDAEVILWGAEDVAEAKIHASNESVDLSEIEKMIVAQALTLQTLGQES